jgi:hypothetical protein
VGICPHYSRKTAANARRFLRDLERTCPKRISHILTDNGKEFIDRLFGLRKRAATGAHDFDRLRADPGIEHRLTQRWSQNFGPAVMEVVLLFGPVSSKNKMNLFS